MAMPEDLRRVLSEFRIAAYTFEEASVRDAMDRCFSPSASIHLCHPFGDLQGPSDFYQSAYRPLLAAMPDLERRDIILMAGTTPEGSDWVAACGNYLGTFVAPFLDIPPTGQLAHMRYHEFFRIENGKVAEMQAIWDLPELMMQAGTWPMAPQLGGFAMTPAPATQDGLALQGDGSAAMEHVLAMLADMVRHPAQGGPEVMHLDTYWHPRFNWYGPAGIGICRGISGFRNWHQIPFLRAMPDRKVDESGGLASHWLGEGNYASETGWPNMRLTLTNDGWLGIPPLDKPITLRSLDFWRLEDGLIRENWVLVDLLDMYAQIGVDVLARLREFNKARNLAPIHVPSGMN